MPLPIVPIAVAVALAIYGSFVGGQYRGRSAEHDKRVAEVATIKAEIESERAGWIDLMIDVTGDLTNEASNTQAGLHVKLAATGGELAAALERLRKHPAGMPAAPAKPASSAPAQCRDYEASPGLLPERDRELLIRLGYAANRRVLERAGCAEQYDEVKLRIAEENTRLQRAGRSP